MAKISAKYIEQNAIECCGCGKRIWRDMAIYADGIQTCSNNCAQDVLAQNEYFVRVGA